MKKIISISILTILILFSFYSIYFLVEVVPKDTHTKCGVVQSKSEQMSSSRHHNRTDLYLNVKYESGEFESVRVDNNSYYFNNVGDRVCFNLDNERSIGFILLQFIGFSCIIIYGFILIGSAIYYFGCLISWCIENI